jgi:hypothetical protein
MSSSGDDSLLIRARSVLLDALTALASQNRALILIGAQAIYLHTGGASSALAEATKDSDLAIDPRLLGELPLLEDAMSRAGFHRNLQSPQPGSWLSSDGIPVDLMVPEALAGPGSRGARIPPHDRHATRRAVGLEAVLVDHAPMQIEALAEGDMRVATVNVAGPAGLLVAKLHKLSERREQPNRLVDKDAHDIYRLLVAVSAAALATRLNELASDDIAGVVTRQAVEFLDDLFASGPVALGSAMAGRAEELVGDPEVVAAASSALARDVLAAIDRR